MILYLFVVKLSILTKLEHDKTNRKGIQRKANETHVIIFEFLLLLKDTTPL